MNLTSYLTQRRNSQYWQLRMMVPKPVRALIGKVEFTKSLGVTCRYEAERLAYPLLAKWKALVASASRTLLEPRVCLHAPTVEELEEAAIYVGHEVVVERAANLSKAKARLGEEAYGQLYEKLEERLALFNRHVVAEDFSPWGEMARRTIEKHHWNICPDSDAFGTLTRFIAQATIDALGRTLAKIDGTEQTFVPSEFVRKAKTRQTETAKRGETIAELFELYAAQRVAEGVKRPAGIDQDRTVIKLFASYVGETRSAGSITIDDAREFRNTIAKLPPNFSKRKDYRGLGIREAAEKAVLDGERPISPVTRARYISTVSPYFSWLKSEGYTQMQPFDGLHQRTKRGENPRPPFSADQLNKLLQSPLFGGFEADGTEHLPGNVRADDWRYWIPLICLFTGARISEVAQLRVDDIVMERDVWFVHFKNDKKSGQQTKSGRSRGVALHSKLVEIGLLDFHTRQARRAATDGNQQLFPNLEAGPRNQFGDKPSRFWRDYLVSIGIKKGKDGIGAHSFRHTISDQFRLAGYMDQEFGPIVLGHSDKSVTGGYGQLSQGTVAMRHAMIESVKFEGVEFDHLVI